MDRQDPPFVSEYHVQIYCVWRQRGGVDGGRVLLRGEVGQYPWQRSRRFRSRFYIPVQFRAEVPRHRVPPVLRKALPLSAALRLEQLAPHLQSVRLHSLQRSQHSVHRIQHEQVGRQVRQRPRVARRWIQSLKSRAGEGEHRRKAPPRSAGGEVGPERASRLCERRGEAQQRLELRLGLSPHFRGDEVGLHRVARRGVAMLGVESGDGVAIGEVALGERTKVHRLGGGEDHDDAIINLCGACHGGGRKIFGRLRQR
mmetsp:Transcript_26425/g.56194  ORF Transcript_26425/g.56194 Transcript_26425/m.56194 type:complete len:256 (-) Transcript_26425:267-1034(-)